MKLNVGPGMLKLFLMTWNLFGKFRLKQSVHCVALCTEITTHLLNRSDVNGYKLKKRTLVFHYILLNPL